MATAGHNLTREGLESGGLASAIDAEESKSFALGNSDGKVSNSDAGLQAESLAASAFFATHGVFFAHTLDLDNILSTFFNAGFFLKHVLVNVIFISVLVGRVHNRFWLSSFVCSSFKADKNDTPDNKVGERGNNITSHVLCIPGFAFEGAASAEFA